MKRLLSLLATVCLFQSSFALAHHSFSAEFDRDQSVKLHGLVTKVEWTNPHVWIYINVKNEVSKKNEIWGIEMGPPHGLQRNGWVRDTLSVGTVIDAVGWKARNGSARVNAKSITVSGTGATPGQTLDAASSNTQSDK